MKAIPLTRSVSFVPFVEHLRTGGASVDAHLAVARISPEMFNSAENLMPLQQAGGFISRSARLEGIEDLGLRVGTATPITSLGLFGLVLSEALTLKDLLLKLVQLIPALDSGARAWLRPKGDGSVELGLHHDTDQGRAQIDAYALMLLIDAVRLATGPDWRPREVALDVSAGRLASQHEALAEAAVQGDVDHIAFSFPEHFLGLPVRRRRQPTMDDAERELISTAPPTDLAESISRTIRSTIWSGVPTIEETADLGGTSVRTLQRQLAKGGIAYHELVDRARFHEALPMLKDSRIKLAAIADHLGYSDAANFTRAFRRWTASTPCAFRALLLRKGQPVDTCNPFP